MKNIMFALIVGNLAITPLIVTSCIKFVEFEVKNLNISPSEVVQGEPATVSLDVVNVGVNEGICDITLLVDGVETETKGIKLAPGGEETMEFTVTRNECGTCQIELAGLTGTIMVLEPAQFEVSNLNIPEEVIAGEPVTVTVMVSNVGPTEGEYTASLIIDGVEETVDTAVIAPGEDKIMAFTCARPSPGDYSVQIDELTGTMTVRELIPAEFEVTSLSVSPNPALIGNEVAVTFIVENVGEAYGTFAAELMIDGEREATRNVYLAGEELTYVSFPISRDSPGSYQVSVDSRQKVLEVVEPVRLDNGTYLVKELKGGRGVLTVENEYYDLDMVFVMCSAEEPDVASLAFYVQARDSHKVRPIPEGTYIYYVTLGGGWDDDSKRFIADATYWKSADEFEFEQKTTGRTRQWQEWTFSFKPAWQPGLMAYEYQFPSLEVEEEE